MSLGRGIEIGSGMDRSIDLLDVSKIELGPGLVKLHSSAQALTHVKVFSPEPPHNLLFGLRVVHTNLIDPGLAIKSPGTLLP